MPLHLSIDGRLASGEGAAISALDRAFLYGDGVFEVYRTYEGLRFAEGAHIQRLQRSAEALGMPPLPPGIDLAAEIGRALASAGYADAVVRLILSRGVGGRGLDPSGASGSRRLVVVSELESPPAEWYRDGVSAGIVETPRWFAGRREAGAKAMSYLDNLLVTGAARDAGRHEALYVDPHGQLLEGASSNLFVIRGRALLTPRTSAGILAGITRDIVLQIARQDGLEVREEALFPSDLYGADEAFISSSIREIVPLCAVDSQPIGAGRPGAISVRLHALYRERIAAEAGAIDCSAPER